MRLLHMFAKPLNFQVPRPGTEVAAESSDRALAGSFEIYSPEDVARILGEANSGRPENQCLLSREVMEKNENICHAMETRRNAITGCPWQIEPGDKSDEAELAAKDFDRQLRRSGGLELDSFQELLDDLSGALLPGFACSEIVWNPGGALAGFNSIESHNITFQNSLKPLLKTVEAPNGMQLTPNKYIFHSYRRRGRDPVRGGLIRPLAWLHCFANINTKNLLQFVERYGMPFFLVKVSAESWEQERYRLKKIIKEMGPGGGAVVRNDTDVAAVQAGNVTGDSYFKLLEYLSSAITKVVLGQTATAGDGGGWGNDSAQSQVRQDILEADCRWIEDTINLQLAIPWCRFNFGDNVVAPRLKILCEPPEDEVKRNQALQSRFEAMGVAVRAGVLTPTVEIEYETRRSFGLPAPSESAQNAWIEGKGVRLPITLQQGNRQDDEGYSNRLAMGAAVDAPSGDLADRATVELLNSGALSAWLGPMVDAIGKVAEKNDEEFGAELEKLAANPEFGNAEDATKILENELITGIAEGIAEAAGKLKK